MLGALQLGRSHVETTRTGFGLFSYKLLMLVESEDIMLTALLQ